MSADGSLLAVAGEAGGVRLVRFPSGDEVASWDGGRPSSRDAWVASNGSGPSVVTYQEDDKGGFLRRYVVGTKQPTSWHPTLLASAAAVSADGGRVAWAEEARDGGFQVSLAPLSSLFSKTAGKTSKATAGRS
jgi:hypothetical protein